MTDNDLILVIATFLIILGGAMLFIPPNTPGG